jgi:hypothetical protein
MERKGILKQTTKRDVAALIARPKSILTKTWAPCLFLMAEYAATYFEQIIRKLNTICTGFNFNFNILNMPGASVKNE